MLNKSVFLCLMQLCLLACSSAEDIISDNSNTNGTRILSRRKRYLVFPEGSSLQLVCEYVWPIVGQPNIWVLAISAALAWQLPSKPEHLRYFKTLKKDGEERIDKFTEKDQLIYKNDVHPAKQKYVPLLPPLPPSYLTQPSFIPWGNSYYDNGTSYSGSGYTRNKIYPSKRIKYYKKGSDFYNEDNYFDHPLYTQLHRRSRRGLYPKIEQFFKAQRKDGKACLLRALCEVSKSPSQKGPFIQEIIKTIFRNKPSQLDEEPDEYDLAASQDEEDCGKLYPTCTYR